VVGVVVAVLLTGCSGTLVEVAASPATIPDSALEPRGYVHGNTTEVPLTYRAGMFGVSRDVTARTWVSGYSKTTAENETAVLIVYSSPNVKVEGESVNPLVHLSNRELVSFVLNRTSDLRTLTGIENVSELSEAGVRDATVLGTETRTASYVGTADLDGVRTGVVVDVTVVEHGEDVVVALGVYGDALEETENHVALVRRLEHEG
jgi:hypothetical protein